MVIVRAVRLEDTDQLWSLIEQATYGLTTLQITKEQLSERIEHSNFAFHRKTEKPSGEPYVFVMEDSGDGSLVGLSCIFSKTGGYEPFYSYQRVVDEVHCKALNKTQKVETLQLAKIHDGPTEIGSLFLLPEYRGQGRGRMLSLTRFTFMASHPKRFADEVIAEMRGVMDSDGNCPFWEAIGRYFFDMDFPQADSLSTIDKRFIEDLMPQYPIYVSMLPDEAKAILGEVHKDTRAALAMLRDEGFSPINLIDIFDGGPVVSCELSSINAVQRTQRCKVGLISNDVSGSPIILASNVGGFRAMIGTATMETSSEGDEMATIDQIAALTLQVRVGDTITMTPLHPSKEHTSS